MSKIITMEDIKNFSQLSGDENPVHLDAEYAKNTIFKDIIAHGLYVASLISAVIANKMPGAGSIYLGQDLKFLKPAYVGDEIVAEVSVLDFPKSNFAKLKTVVTNQRKEIVIEGTALVKLS